MEKKSESASREAKSNERMQNRREFVKKYGKYGAATPLALTIMMTPGQKAAAQSDGPSDAGP